MHTKYLPDRLIIVAFLFLCVVIIILIAHGNMINKLKNGKIPSLKIKGVIKSIEYVRGARLAINSIVGGYIIVEATDPSTKQKKTYRSNLFTYTLAKQTEGAFSSFEKNKEEFYKYVKKYVAVGDHVEVIVSKKNPRLYYIPELVK